MTCLSPAQVARVASGELESVHASECLACRRRVDDDRQTRQLLGALPAPRLTRKHAIAAELFARIEQRGSPTPARRYGWFAVGAMAAAAAASMLLLVRDHTTAPVPAIATGETVDVATSLAAREQVAPALPAPRIDASSGARISHVVGDERDVVTLADGTLEIDTRASRDVDVRVGNTIVHIADAAVTIRARKQAIVNVHVVVGAAHIEAPDGHVTLERDALWTPSPTATQLSLAAFRDGWIALRAGQHREAIAQFDRVTDPVVLEEAMYWSVIAAHRAGDRELARERTAAFLRAFPQSDYAASLVRD